MERLRRLQYWLVRHTPQAVLFYPFQLFLCLLCLLAGPQLLLAGPTPGSPDQLVPGWLLGLWAWDLIVGALLVLVGLLARRMTVEGAGLLLLGVTSLAYAALQVLFAGWQGLAGGVIVGLFGATCFARRYVIRSALSMGQLRDPGR